MINFKMFKMKKIIVPFLALFMAVTMVNANYEPAIAVSDECADFAGLVYEGSRLRGMSRADSYELARWAYEDCEMW